MPGEFHNPRGTLYYRRAGRGPCVILCHALGTDSTLWAHAVRALSRTYTVITYDLRGHGNSPPAADHDYSFEAMADDVRELLEHQRLERVSVVGISVGGEVAQMFAARHAHLVQRLVLCSTACVTEPARAGLWEQRISAVASEGMQFIAAMSTERWFTARFRKRHPHIVEGYRRRLSRLHPEVYVAMARTIQRMDLRPAIRIVSCPTLVVYGNEDHNTGAAAAATIAQNITGARVSEISATAHFPNLEAPRRFNRTLLEWLGQKSLLSDTPG